MTPAADEEWVCLCRKCHGVHTDQDALQFAYEFLVGEDQQHEMVVTFEVFGADGRSSLTRPFLDGEPDALEFIGLRGWTYSFRPGKSAVPTEADIARWERWRTGQPKLRDWFLVDGDRWSSLVAVTDALRARRPVPRPAVFSNYWWREPVA